MSSKLSLEEESEIGKKRMERFLEATKEEFEEAVRRADQLELPITGVLAGPVKKKEQ